MWLTTSPISLFIILFSINQSFSAIFWYFKSKSYITDYTNSRGASSHRGVFLTYSTLQKHLLCEDHFSAQLYVDPNQLITDGQDGGYRHDLVVSEISLTGGDDIIVKTSEIFIKCFGTTFEKRNPYASGQYFISYGFHHSRWLASAWLTADGQEHIVLGHNIGSSPQHVPMEQIELEEQYMTTRAIFEELRDESPAYVRLIDARNALSAMTKEQRAVLCASVLSSPIYQDERLEYSSKWILDHTDDLVYYEDSFAFTYNNEKGKKPTLQCDCILCKGFANAEDERSKSTDLCLTRSHDNEDSLYVIKPKAGFNYLDKYFKNIAILTNARELFKNYTEKESLALRVGG